MSYILDALKRADAERERGHVPGLHSRGTPAPAAGTTRPRRIRLPVAVGAIALLLAAATVFWLRDQAPVATQASGAAAQAPAKVAAQPPATAEMVTPPPAPALPILAPAQIPAPPPAPRAATLPAAAVDGSPATPSSAPTPRAPSASAAGVPAGLDGPPPPATAAPASAPAVKVSGVTYSANASHRMLIANGKVVREGEEIEPGLKVEVIAPRSAILNHRGSRYNINY